MTIYIIDEELGPSYWLRLPKDGESLEGKATIELSDAEYKQYADMQEAWFAWQERLQPKRTRG